MRHTRHLYWLLLPPAVLLALFVIGMGYLVLESVRVEDGWALSNFSDFFARPDYVTVLVRTILVALTVTAVSTLIGYPMALAIARYKGNRNFLMMLVITPWLVSVVVRTYGWVVILGPRGSLNSFLLWAGLVESPLRLIFNATGVVIGLVHIFCPFLIISVLTVLLYQDASVEEASQTLGASPLQTFFKVTLPLSMPGVLSGMALVYLLSTGAIVTPLLLGGVRDGLLATQIYQDVLQVFDYPKAASMAMILVVAAFALVLPVQLLERRLAIKVSGRGGR
jgi:putative spermidine/putrescine transport system permease protein